MGSCSNVSNILFILFLCLFLFYIYKSEYTDGLIYMYQPGALNEAESDIFGESIQILYSDSPLRSIPRTNGACTIYLGPLG